ncbi:activator of Hsp90 ATPase [Fennellomyces sp. T-0311]|nr:activator of Hsp90 ATPase [Fennellomyces sp. T-0311]
MCEKGQQELFELGTKLEGLEAENDGHKVSITKLDECVGDCDLNQRKGKIITIYDVSLKMSIQGALADGTEVAGHITIPEVAHDSEADDYVFEIKITDETSAKQSIKPVIRKHLQPLICDKLANFPVDMIATHGGDVYIEASQLNNPAAAGAKA